MLPGPVFDVELLTTARRARYYALRAFYGLALLLIFWASYNAFQQSLQTARWISLANNQWVYMESVPDAGHASPGDLARFSRLTFGWFAIAQGMAVLLITPSLVGGAIAGEKQRKTLHYLLASQLSSGEIVFGKLLARMLMVFVYLLAGVPLLFVLMLFGGVELELILVTFGATVSFAVFLASLSMFFSTMLQQARSAIAMSYVAVVAAILIPLGAEYAAMFVQAVMKQGWLVWLPDAVGWVNPVVNVREIGSMLNRGGVVNSWIVRMVAAQWIYSFLLVTVATRRLRRVAANETARPKVILRLDKKGRPTWRALPRPPIGDDPMLWKERYSSRVGGVGKMLGLFHNLFWVVLIGCLTFEYARTSLRDVLERGYAIDFRSPIRDEFQSIIRQFSLWLAGFWIVGTAVSAASSIASEREDDTWISLVATDLEGPEVLRAKMLGSILRFRWMGLTLVVTWIVGVVCGAIHPLGFASGVVEMAAYLWFAAALGLRFSLPSGSTSKALALTVGCLLFLNAGYLLCCIPLPVPRLPGAPAASVQFLGLMPWVVIESLFSAADDRAFSEFLKTRWSNDILSWVDQPIVAAVASVLLYAAGAAALTASAYSRFNAVVGRPRRGDGPREGPGRGER